LQRLRSAPSRHRDIFFAAKKWPNSGEPVVRASAKSSAYISTLKFQSLAGMTHFPPSCLDWRHRTIVDIHCYFFTEPHPVLNYCVVTAMARDLLCSVHGSRELRDR
jgi:hypothetical protein